MCFLRKAVKMYNTGEYTRDKHTNLELATYINIVSIIGILSFCTKIAEQRNLVTKSTDGDSGLSMTTSWLLETFLHQVSNERIFIAE